MPVCARSIGSGKAEREARVGYQKDSEGFLGKKKGRKVMKNCRLSRSEAEVRVVARSRKGDSSKGVFVCVWVGNANR